MIGCMGRWMDDCFLGWVAERLISLWVGLLVCLLVGAWSCGINLTHLSVLPAQDRTSDQVVLKCVI